MTFAAIALTAGKALFAYAFIEDIVLAIPVGLALRAFTGREKPFSLTIAEQNFPADPANYYVAR